jgi:hypothetical protein
MPALRTVLLGLLLTALLPAQVSFKKGDGTIEIQIAGKPFSTFYYGAAAPKPYLHPLRAADGTVVTRGYPMEDIAGESRDHPHHRGLWYTHGDVNGFDFWMNEPGQHPANGGLIVAKGMPRAEAGKIEASFEWKAPGGGLLLTEDRTMTFSGDAKTRVIDFDVTFTAAKESVKFGDTKEGTFAIRLATPLEEQHKGAEGVARTGKMVGTDGRMGEKEIWGKRSPWLDYSGVIDGKPIGIAILDHPKNPKHPTFWHTRSYGLFAANPFGEHDFYNDPKRNGSITIEPGKAIRFRYRVIVHQGDTKTAGIADLYERYRQQAAMSLGN